jgi:hypothetical protein
MKLFFVGVHSHRPNHVYTDYTEWHYSDYIASESKEMVDKWVDLQYGPDSFQYHQLYDRLFVDGYNYQNINIVVKEIKNDLITITKDEINIELDRYIEDSGIHIVKLDKDRDTLNLSLSELKEMKTSDKTILLQQINQDIREYEIKLEHIKNRKETVNLLDSRITSTEKKIENVFNKRKRVEESLNSAKKQKIESKHLSRIPPRNS